MRLDEVKPVTVCPLCKGLWFCTEAEIVDACRGPHFCNRGGNYKHGIEQCPYKRDADA